MSRSRGGDGDLEKTDNGEDGIGGDRGADDRSLLSQSAGCESSWIAAILACSRPGEAIVAPNQAGRCCCNESMAMLKEVAAHTRLLRENEEGIEDGEGENEG